MTPVYIGIDVACGLGKRLPICFVATGERLTPLASLDDLAVLPRGLGNVEVASPAPFRAAARAVAEAVDTLAKTRAWRIERIAIDAPAAPPKRPPRASEAALRDAGLAVFSTPTPEEWKDILARCAQHLAEGKSPSRLPHANKIWMLYGFELFAALRKRLNAEVLETYPFAIVSALIDKPKHKKDDDGYRT